MNTSGRSNPPQSGPELGTLEFKRAVKLGVIERNGNITCDGFHQLDIVARKEIPVNRFAKAEDGDGVLANAAGNEIVQIQLFQSPADGVAHVFRRTGRLKEERPPGELGPS